MPRRPHVLSSSEALRILGEHVTLVSLLLVGVSIADFLRRFPVDPFRPDLDPYVLWPGLASFGLKFLKLPELGAYLPWSILAGVALQYSMYLHGLYDRRRVRRPRLLFLRLTKSAVLAGVVLAVFYFLVKPPEHGRAASLIGAVLAILVLWVMRVTMEQLTPQRPERLLLLGGGPLSSELLRTIEVGRHHLCGFLDSQSDPCLDAQHVPRLGDWERLAAVLESEDIDTLLVASSPPSVEDLAALVAARLGGLNVISVRDFAEGQSGEVVEDDPGVEFITNGTARAYGGVSRLLDVLLSGLTLLLFSPVMLLVALLVFVADRGPILFSQERIGRAGRLFTCWKFRTMQPDAESQGPRWSPREDPRITPLGRFLRRWRVDELPQLVNVLKGDMAFVGPRPEQPFFVERLSEILPHYSLRHLVRPGITGWAQVKFPYGATESEARRKLRFDLFYIKHRSIYLDLAILFDTVRVVLRGGGR